MRPHGAQRVRSKTTIGGVLSELSIESTQSSKRIPVYRILVQWAFCIIAVVFGLRVAQEANLVRVNFSRVDEASELFRPSSNRTVHHYEYWIDPKNESTPGLLGAKKSPRVYVGRHPILVRPWPHPDPVEMVHAYKMIARVQLEQQRLYGIQSWKPIIAITPMYVRTFQSVHLTGLLHTLSLVRGPVTWIVIEAGGASAETAALLSQARVDKLVHLGASEQLPQSFKGRRILESHLRIEGLRYVREHNLEGAVVFADDSNVYSMQFFDAAQKVRWVGTFPVGILGHAGFEEPDLSSTLDFHKPFDLPVQAPTCDTSGNIKGWHAFGSRSLDGEFVKGDREEETKLEWAGFVLNARAVWTTEPDRPKWIKEWIEWAHPEDGQYIDLRSIVSDETKVEALGRCGSDEAVLVWWARMEARSDSKFPSRWALDSPLEIIVPAKRTPWPDRIFPLSSPPPPAPQTTKHRGGNRSGGRDGKSRRGKRRPDVVKSRPLDNQRESSIVSKGMRT
ncbi:hypothetical protein M758_10G121900 [Ceratodon purpureus]|uniref:Glycosyltransferases n=1 Tax=Ceratodon purpureus TaxID=3225 RepID=A0A8T0GL96_CERPU|nr:hypothetical protein KC19_10G126600 [Ceratodon purpureus]KAG0603807.1 hypothetical protein M758_10G121800 [Ceratodon purpureus]KAG0603809.1 hypothetical protein M758_10G121900 [Ceratodon purpureus]